MEEKQLWNDRSLHVDCEGASFFEHGYEVCNAAYNFVSVLKCHIKLDHAEMGGSGKVGKREEKENEEDGCGNKDAAKRST